MSRTFSPALAACRASQTATMVFPSPGNDEVTQTVFGGRSRSDSKSTVRRLLTASAIPEEGLSKTQLPICPRLVKPGA